MELEIIMLSEISQPRKAKGWAGGVAQVVEHPPSKCETLNSNPRTVKKKKISQFACFCTFIEPRLKMLMMIIIIGHECEQETMWGVISGRGRGKGKETEKGRRSKYTPCLCSKTAE
jgi:hypothetical protein